MVVIRLSRTGTKNNAFYHIVATDSRKARDSGRYIERLGFYNPNFRGQETGLFLEQERIDYWKSKGAQISDRVNTLIKQFVKGSLQSQGVPQSKPEKVKKSVPEVTTETKSDKE